MGESEGAYQHPVTSYEPSRREMDKRITALEQSAQANEAALGELDGAIHSVAGSLEELRDQMRTVLLWLAKQPWEVDQATTWDDLVAKASAGPKKESKFRAEVVL